MSIEKRGQNKYRFRVQYKNVPYSVNWEGSEEQAKIMHDLFVAEVKAGKYQEQAKMAQEEKEKEKRTLEYVWDLYLKSKQLAAGTIITHKHAQGRMTALMQQDITTITKAQMLEHYLNDDKKTKSNNEYRILSQVLNFAVSLDIIDKNPITFKLASFHKDPFAELFNEDEITKLIQALLNEKNITVRCMFLLQIGTGARIGEILGLIKENIDTENHIMHIKQQYKIINASTQEYGIGKTKTKSSVRSVFIPTMVRQDLYEILKTKDNGDFIFADEFVNVRNKSLHANYLLERICKQAEIKRLTSHKLRNLYTTIAYYSKMSPLTISKNLGHTTMKMTESYLTVINSKTQAESQKIDNFLESFPEKSPDEKQNIV